MKFVEIQITYKDHTGASHVISTPNTSYESCNGHRYIVGGIRPCKPEEKKRKNHKWFRWIELDEPVLVDNKTEKEMSSTEFVDLLDQLSYSARIV